MRTTLTAISVGLTLFVGTTRVNAVTVDLYSGTLGGTPDTQPWFDYTAAPGATQAFSSGATNLNTIISPDFTSNPIYAGYSNYNSEILPTPSIGSLKNPSFPVLDRTTGYTLSFIVRINSEFHDDPNANAPNRAGFSVTALSNDLRGIELGFWQNEIWQQNGGVDEPPRFTHGPGNTTPLISTLTGALTQYDLNILGDTYTLNAGGSSILSGSLQDYSAEGQPYDQPNFVFLGDRSQYTRANIDLACTAVTTGSATDSACPPLTTDPATPIPFEFSPTLGLLLLGSWGAVHQFSKLSKQKVKSEKASF